MYIINPRRACAARVTVLGLCVCVCVCVRLSPLILALQGPSRLISDTNGSSATRARRHLGDMALKQGDKATYLHGPPIQAQWNIGSFTMSARTITRFQ